MAVARLKYPVFGLGWVPQSKGPPLILFSGGGGSAKTGVPNCVSACVLTIGEDGKPTLTEKCLLDTEDELVAHISVAPKGGLLACGMGNQCHLLRFNQKGTAIEDLLSFQTDFAETDSFQNAVVFNNAGDRVACGGQDGVVRVWNVRKRDGSGLEVSQAFEAEGHQKAITALSFNSNGSMVASTSRDATCRIWQSGLGDELAVLQAPQDAGPKVFFRSCTFVPSSNDLLTVHTAPAGPAYLIEWGAKGKSSMPTNWEARRVVRLSKGPICCMCCGDGYLGFGSNDGSVFVLDAETLKHVSKAQAHHLPVTGASFMPGADPPVLVTASADSTCHVLRVVPSQFGGVASVLALLVVIALLVYWLLLS